MTLVLVVLTVIRYKMGWGEWTTLLSLMIVEKILGKPAAARVCPNADRGAALYLSMISKISFCEPDHVQNDRRNRRIIISSNDSCDSWRGLHLRQQEAAQWIVRVFFASYKIILGDDKTTFLRYDAFLLIIPLPSRAARDCECAIKICMIMYVSMYHPGAIFIKKERWHTTSCYN